MTTGKKACLWIGLGGAALCCLGVTIPLWVMLNGGDNLDRAVVEYRRAGLPWTAAEVNPSGRAADADNAAPILNRAFAMLGPKVSDEGSKAWISITGGNGTEARSFVAKYASTLALAKEAAGLPRADFHKDWDVGPEVIFPELAAVKGVVRLLAIRAVLEARTGSTAASNSDLADAWAVARFAGQEPSLISLLVQIAGRAIVTSAAEQCVAVYRNRPEALTALKAQLAKMGDEPNFGRAVRGEAYIGLTVLRNGAIFRSRILRNQGPDDPPPPPIDPRKLQRTGSPSGLFERLMGGKLLKHYVRLDGIARRDAGDPKKLSDDLRALDLELEQDHSLTGIYRAMLAPVYTNAGQTMAQDRARRLTVTALVGAMLTRARTGHYPARIADIPGRWIDPFDGKPLRLKVKGDSIRIYSVGPNLKDDGGVTRVEVRGTSREEYDIVAAYPPAVAKKGGTP